MASTRARQRQISNRYLYQPLNAKKYQIRLLKLRADSEHAPHYDLTIFDYESAPSYVALSYTWGPETPTAFVTIESKSFEVRQNLSNFLSAYKEDAYLWIDQICIDQSNFKERAHQVGLMFKIYVRCVHVLVWLRNESTYVPSTYQAALDFNQGVKSYAKDDTHESGSDDDETVRSRSVLSRSVLVLLRNSYFERLWIVQELLLNENIRILVEGDVWITWKSLRENLSDEIQKTIPSTSWMVDNQLTRFIFANHSSKSLSYYLTLTAGKYSEQKCENPRDKVYGFMALVGPTSKLTVDYAKSIQDIYLDAFWVMLKEYWDMLHDIPECGYEIFRVRWTFEESKSATWKLAQAMGFTSLELCGLKSFIDGVWNRIYQYEVKVKMAQTFVKTKTHSINIIGFDRENYPSFNHNNCKNEPTTAVSRRWWYKLRGQKYYHDCRKWSGDWKHQEYTESRGGGRVYGP